MTSTIMCSTIKSSTTAALSATALNSQLTMQNTNDISLLLPPAHATVLLTDISSIVANCHRRFARYTEMDAANAHDLVQAMASAPAFTLAETEALEWPILDEKWRRIPGTVSSPVEYFQIISEVSSVGASTCATAGGAAWGKATCIVDASAVSVFSYLWAYCSYERLLQHEQEAKGMLHVEREVSTHSKIMISNRKFPGKLLDRVFAAFWVWSASAIDSSITVKFGDITAPLNVAAANAIIVADPRASKAIRGGKRAPQAERNALYLPFVHTCMCVAARECCFIYLCSHMCVVRGSRNVHPQLREAFGD